MAIYIISLTFLAGLLTLVQARPVSYPGGWTVMSLTDSDKNTFHGHYSPTARLSVGYKHEYWRDTNTVINAIQINNLIKRWNQPDSQANFYSKSGFGVSDGKPAAFTGIATDWETRRYFASYENRYTEADSARFYMQSGRIGIAPYVGNYGDWHTWFMLQVDHMPATTTTLTLTPLVRVFKSVYLLELGIRNGQDILVSAIFRY